MEDERLLTDGGRIRFRVTLACRLLGVQAQTHSASNPAFGRV
jgi:hypothetical protein